MKRSPSELVLEELFRNRDEKSAAAAAAASGAQRRVIADSDGLFSLDEDDAENFAVGDLLKKPPPEKLNGFQGCEGPRNCYQRSQNVDVKHSCISTTIDSQSSICGTLKLMSQSDPSLI